MTKDEVLAILKALGDEKRKQVYRKNGAGENTYGALRGELRKLAKQLGKIMSWRWGCGKAATRTPNGLRACCLTQRS